MIEKENFEGWSVYAQADGETPVFVAAFRDEGDATKYVETQEDTSDDFAIVRTVGKIVIWNDTEEPDLEALRRALESDDV